MNHGFNFAEDCESSSATSYTREREKSARTNLSTFWNWDRLHDIVTRAHAHRFQLDSKPLYTGCMINRISPATACAYAEQYDLTTRPVVFASGTTIVLNRAAARLLATAGSNHVYYAALHTIDDVLIAWVLDALGVTAEDAGDVSWLAWPNAARLSDLRDPREYPAFRTRGVSLEATYFRMLSDQYRLGV